MHFYKYVLILSTLVVSHKVRSVLDCYRLTCFWQERGGVDINWKFLSIKSCLFCRFFTFPYFFVKFCVWTSKLIIFTFLTTFLRFGPRFSFFLRFGQNFCVSTTFFNFFCVSTKIFVFDDKFYDFFRSPQLFLRFDR